MCWRLGLLALLTVGLLGRGAPQAWGQGADPVLGVSALGSGGTSAVALPDPFLSSLNPALAARYGHYSAGLVAARPFGLLSFQGLGGTAPLSERSGLALEWLRIGYQDAELSYRRDRLRVGIGQALWDWLAIGAAVAYRVESASLDGEALGQASGWSLDWGVQARIPTISGLMLGWTMRNWMSPRPGGRWSSGAWVHLQGGGEARILPREVRWGMRYHWEEWSLLLERAEGWSLGLEREVSDRGALRLGLWDRRRAGESLRWTFGATFRWRSFAVDYAWVAHPALENTSYFAVRWEAPYRIPPVAVEGIVLADLYAVLRSYYARPILARELRPYEEPLQFSGKTQARIGELWLYNPTERSVRIGASVRIPGFTSPRGSEVVGSVEIGPGERRIVPMERLLLNDRAGLIREDRLLEAEVEIYDLDRPDRRRTTARVPVRLYGRNKIRLDELAKLSVYVVSTDPTLAAFVDAVLPLAEDPRLLGLPRPLRTALVLLTALQGISYRSDPNLPYESGTVDAIQFPAEMLIALSETGERPAGDCDDMTVLVAALLEAAGVPTALIQAPRHVFLAFDPGGYSIERAQAEGWDRWTIAIDGVAWIPIETTAVPQGAAAAWREGVQQLQRPVLDSVRTAVGWERYGVGDVEKEGSSIQVDRERIREELGRVLEDPWLEEALESFRR
ncbi:MAG: hypothetical protein KatS3mg115_0188 [Candidatus Poribacteria bacterium]|nr:MAG: hypothetical protein KatS3mg115_0188 [Candidatus Poribacteria bacterium]